jgi:hypothetical protein
MAFTYTQETPESSNIARFAYDESLKELQVTFKSGATYSYSGIPKEVVDSWKTASSKGSYFFEKIRKAGYPYMRVSR